MSLWFDSIEVIDALARSSIVLFAAILLHWLMGKKRLPGRHILWTIAFTALLILPIFTLFAPRPDGGIIDVTDMSLALLPETANSPGPLLPVATETALSVVQIIYLIGAGIAALWFAAGWWHARRLVKNAEPLRDIRIKQLCRSGSRIPRLLVSAETAVPLALGIFRPVLVLPAHWLSWNNKTLAAVLSHELVHIRRRDLLWRALAQFACGLYWFNPLVWLGLRTLMAEQELACDDAVIRSGIRPTFYARAMLAVASDVPPALAGAAMGKPPSLSMRVSRILTRNQVNAGNKWMIASIASLLLITLSGAASVGLFRDDVAESMALSGELAQFKLQMAATRNQSENSRSNDLMKRKAEEMAARGMSKEEIAKALKIVPSSSKQRPVAATAIKNMPDKATMVAIELRAQRLFELKKRIAERTEKGSAQPANQ